MESTNNYESVREVARETGYCERTIRRWSDAGYVRSKVVQRGLMKFRLYHVGDATKVAAGHVTG